MSLLELQVSGFGSVLSKLPREVQWAILKEGDNHSLDVEIRHLMAEAFENCAICMREHMM